MGGGGGGGLVGGAVKIGTLGAVNPGGRGWLGDISGANQAADAAQNAAMAQQDAANSMYQNITTERDRLEKQFNVMSQATPEELAGLSRAFSAADQGLAREEKLLASIDPALMEASKQALGLLRGESADINKPMMDLRNNQRQQLMNSLRSQYGPGAESSSIGQQALRQFDMETNTQMAQNQQNALGQAFGIATSDVGARQRAGIGTLMGVQQGYGAIQQRRIGARLGLAQSTLGAMSGAAQPVIQSAGAQFTGDALRAQGQQALFNQAVQVGGMALGNYMGGKGMAAGMAAQQQQPQAQANWAGGNGGGYGNMA